MKYQNIECILGPNDKPSKKIHHPHPLNKYQPFLIPIYEIYTATRNSTAQKYFTISSSCIHTGSDAFPNRSTTT